MEDKQKGLSVIEAVISCSPWIALIYNVVSWQEKLAEQWGISLIILFTLSTFSMEYFKWLTLPDFEDDLENCNWFGITPNGKLLSLLFRGLSLVLAILQILVFLDTRNGFNTITSKVKLLDIHPYLNVTIPSDFNKFTGFASAAALLYAASGLILLITLCQCGARLKNNKENNIHKTEILRWALHDIILGSIWLALSVEFHDLVDDLDDSNWRHLFSSMVVFHVIILLFDIMANPKYNINWKSKNLALWSPATKPALKEILRFIFYSIIYYCLLNRLHENILLVNMGITIDSLNAVVIASSCLILVNISEINLQKKVVISKVKTVRNMNAISTNTEHRGSVSNDVRGLNF